MKGKLPVLQWIRVETWDKSKLGGPSWYSDDLLKLIKSSERSSKIYTSIFVLWMETRSAGRSIMVSSAYYRHEIPGFQGQVITI